MLATRYRPILVWLGVGAAFAVQTTVAVLLGHAASFLPEEVVQVAAAVLFLVGAVMLLREAREHQRGRRRTEEYDVPVREAHGFRAVLASFLVLFAAEWGDLSQLLTISLVARYEDAAQRVRRRARRAARRQRAGGRRRPDPAAVREAARAALRRRGRLPRARWRSSCGASLTARGPREAAPC